MKKIIAFLLAAVMLFALAGCGGENTGDGVYTVGVFQYSDHEALALATQGFMEALATKLGSDKVIFDIQNALDDPAMGTTIINKFISNDVDLILANATPALRMTAAAVTDIPVLGTSVTDYGTALGIDNFSGVTGTNVSGTTDLAPLDQQAQMILQLVPEAKEVGMLYCSSEENSIYQIKEVEKYLKARGIVCKEYAFAGSNEVAAMTEKAIATSDAIYIPTDNIAASTAELIDSICRPAKVPVIAADTGTCGTCGIATMDISYFYLGYKTGEMAAKILTGEEDVSKMAIEGADAVIYMYNEEICKELGITVPETYQKIN